MNTPMIQLTPSQLKEVMNEYKYEVDYVNDDIETIILHQAIDNLPEADKIIFLLYAEMGSLRKVAKILGVSYATTRKAVNKIKEDIKNELHNLADNYSSDCLYN